MHAFRRYSILLLLLMSYFSKTSAETNMHDSTRVIQLFEQGNRFIDGPSDSLMFYYQKALVIIRENLGKYRKSKDEQPLYHKFRSLELRVFIEFGIEYFYRSNYEKALENYFAALAIAEELNDPDGLSECYSEIGIVYKNQGRLSEALDYYEKALAMAQKGSDSSWVASCMINIGNIYKDKNLLITSLNYYLDALKILEKLGHDRRIAACYHSIGDVYSQQRDFDKALNYFNKSLQLAVETEDRTRETGCYLSIGNVCAQKRDYVAARQFYDKAIKLYDITGYRHEMDDCYILIGDSYLEEHNYDEALHSYNKALQISIQENDLPGLAEISGNLGRIYILKKQYPKARDFGIKSLVYAEKCASLDLMVSAHATLSEVYESLGQPSAALMHQKQYAVLKDSLFSAEKFKTITEMEVKYESAKKEQQLALLQQQTEVQQLKLESRKRVLMASFLGSVMLLLIAYLLFRHSRLKARQKATELEQRLLLSQMNPHFIFNSLIAIQGFIYQNEPILAGDFLAKFADLVRITLESSRDGFITLEKEIKMLEAYLALQKLRFEQKFDYTIGIDPTLEGQEIKLPAMFAQPFIENAVEHGLRHRSSGGLLKVDYSLQHDCCIRIVIEDNGVGREASAQIEHKQNHKSLAMKITNERLSTLSRAFKQQFSLRLIDLKNAEGNCAGLRVDMEIPVRKNGNL
ncbi:MAG: tetratricopeptide repeat protein [Lentimicrobium sp.]|nr:tetratricopeptide repeat protein [Lentimicrobium sp.]